MIKAIYSQMGLILGEIVYDTSEEFAIKNPVLVITQREHVILNPILMLMEEDVIHIKKSTVLSTNSFTPIVDLINQYNQMYGAGIIQASQVSGKGNAFRV